MATNVENTLNKLMVGPQHRFENGAVIQPAWPAKYAGPILPLQQVPEQFRAELDEMSAEYMRKLEQHPFRAKFGPGGGLRVIPSGERVPVQFDPKDLELIAAETHRPTLLQASKAPIAEVADAARRRLLELDRQGNGMGPHPESDAKPGEPTKPDLPPVPTKK